jgi:CRISPR-associated protein Cmr4
VGLSLKTSTDVRTAEIHKSNDQNPVMNEKRILYLFTRTPLHVGAGASVGAIDQPIIRERHTGFPVIPATSLKGTFADAWNDGLLQDGNKKVRVKGRQEGDKTVWETSEVAWLFGSDDANHSFAGALQFSEARLLAFPIRSARGSFAWITCPLMLARAARDGVKGIKALTEDEAAVFSGADGDANALFTADGPLTVKVKEGNSEESQVVLEEYTFTHVRELPSDFGKAFAELLLDDPVWQEVASRLVVLSNGMMSFFARNACEVAQHVRISDETGTAEGGALFNQENVPSEAMFYSVLHAFDERTADKDKAERRNPDAVLKAFAEKTDGEVFQFGGDASTGLGYCTVKFNAEKGA